MEIVQPALGVIKPVTAFVALRMEIARGDYVLMAHVCHVKRLKHVKMELTAVKVGPYV